MRKSLFTLYFFVSTLFFSVYGCFILIFKVYEPVSVCKRRDSFVLFVQKSTADCFDTADNASISIHYDSAS